MPLQHVEELHPYARSLDNPGRNETEAERDDRNIVELVQELRVGALGVQVLFGFLLSLPFFAVHFGRLNGVQRSVYVTDLLLAALATAFFSAPVAYHRVVFRRHRKRRLTRVSNIFAIAGLATVGLAISASVWLALSYTRSELAASVLSLGTLMTFFGLWGLIPLAGRNAPNR